MTVIGSYTASGGIVSADGSMAIPPDPNNRHYQQFKAMEAAGDTIEAYVAPAPTGDDVDNERERRIGLPLTVTLSVGSISINMDDKSQRNLQGLASVGQYLVGTGSSQTTTFRDYNNTDHDLTPTDLVSMGLQVAARIQAVYDKSWALKAMDPIPADYADDSYWS